MELSRSVRCADDIDWDKISQLTPNFSGADLHALLTTAQINAAQQIIGEDSLYRELSLPNRVTSNCNDATIQAADNKDSIDTKNEEITTTQAVDNKDSTDTNQEQPPSILRDEMKNISDMSNLSLENFEDENRQVIENSDFQENVSSDDANSEHFASENIEQSHGRMSALKPRHQQTDTDKRLVIKLSHVLSAVTEVKPSVTEQERRKYERLHRQFSGGRKAAMTPLQRGSRATLA